MIDAVLSDSSNLSPVLLTLKLEANEYWEFKVTEQEDRFDIPAAHPELVDKKLSMNSKVIRPQEKFRTLMGQLVKKKSEIILVDGDGRKFEFKRL